MTCYLACNFDEYEAELRDLIVDLDKLVDKKKTEWKNKISRIENKLLEERTMHNKTKSIIALKDVEISRLVRNNHDLMECNESLKREYELQVSSLKDSAVFMSENLNKLQAKYKKWRSRCASKAEKQSVGTYCDLNCFKDQFLTPSRDNRLPCELDAPRCRLNEQEDYLDTSELNSRYEVNGIEHHLREITGSVSVRDEEYLSMKMEQCVRLATRNFQMQWSPPPLLDHKCDVATQVYTKVNSITVSTMTNPKLIGHSKSEFLVIKLEREVKDKNKRLRDLEDAHAAAMDMAESFRAALEDTKVLLAKTTAELNREKLRLRPRERRCFISKACQCEPQVRCHQQVEAKPISTRCAECQTADDPFADELPGNIPGFLTQALMDLNQQTRSEQPIDGNDAVSAGNIIGELPKEQTNGAAQCRSEIPLATETEVDVSVDSLDVSQEPETNVQAILACWKSTEDELIEQLRSSPPRASPKPAYPIARGSEDAATHANDVSTKPSQDNYPSSLSTFTLPVRLQGTTLNNIQNSKEPAPSRATKSTFTTFATPNGVQAMHQMGSCGNFQASAVTATGDDSDKRDALPPGEAGGSQRRGRIGGGGGVFVGPAVWSDEDVEQLTAHFLAAEREHSYHLEAAIERHLEGLRTGLLPSDAYRQSPAPL